MALHITNQNFVIISTVVKNFHLSLFCVLLRVIMTLDFKFVDHYMNPSMYGVLKVFSTTFYFTTIISCFPLWLVLFLSDFLFGTNFNFYQSYFSDVYVCGDTVWFCFGSNVILPLDPSKLIVLISLGMGCNTTYF